MYYVYILYSEKSDTYYVGYSQRPEIRLTYHNTKEKGFTSRYRPWKLVFTQEFTSKADAMKAEKTIKSWKSKKGITQLVSGEILTWVKPGKEF